MPLAAEPTLKRDAASFWNVLAQGLMSNGPLASTTVALTAAASFGLGSTPLAYVVGIVVVWLWINTPYQFSKRLASASGMYYFVAKGVSTEAGYMAGLSYALYYLFLIPANSLFFGVLVPVLLGQLGVATPSWLWVPLALVFLIPVAVLNVVGVRTSLNYGIVTVVIEIVVLVIVSIAVIAGVGPHNTMSVFSTRYAAGGLSGFGIAMLVAAFGMSGSTATVYLGEETKAPQETIRRALIWATVIVVLLYVLVSYALTVGWGVDKMSSFAAASVPGLLVVKRYMGVVPEIVIGVLAINSIIGVNVAATIVVSRLLYSFGKAGLFPAGYAAVDPRHRTPARAIIWTTVAAAVIVVLVGLWQGPSGGFIFCILVATMAEFLGHLVGNLGLPFYYLRQQAFGLFLHGIVPILSIVTILLGLWTTFVPPTFPTWIAPALGIVVVLAGWLQVRMIRAQSPERARQVDASLANIGADVAQ
jgi:amino acid transporter